MTAPDRRLVRVDFVGPGTCCASCGRELTVGHIVREAETERAYGPVCVSRLFDDAEAFRRIGARKDTRDPSGEEPSRKAACASHPRRCARSGAGRPEGVLGPCATAQRSVRRAHFRMSFGNVSCAAGAGPIK